MMQDCLVPERISNLLRTIWIGKNMIYLDTIDSTNSESRRRAAEEAEGTVILAEQQTAGKGRFGREWSSPKSKGIWMSILLKPDLSSIKIPQLTLIAAAAVCLALDERSLLLPDQQVKIKWPNDIFLAGKKIGGILTEMQVRDNKVQSVIVGIGLNVNLGEEDVSGDLIDKATSLYLETGRVQQREPLVAGILNYFESLYLQYLTTEELGETLTICRQKSAVIGRKVDMTGEKIGQAAEVLDLGPQGELVVKLDNGEITSLISGEISILLQDE